ncbi:uncharacterized protein [Eurosta solidaginis]|uniref:uncharacterized protein n=1 Tax=Eurosta solidaginis TaxID=178769 RepID=UPI0035311197
MAKNSAIALALLGAVLLNILGHCEMSVYPGLRRKPLRQYLQQPLDVSSDYLSQLMEENARRRLQQTIEQQLERIHMQRERLSQRLQLLAAEHAEDNEENMGEDVSGSSEIDEDGDTYDANRYQYNSYKNFDANNNNILSNGNNNLNGNQYVDSYGLFSYKYPPPKMGDIANGGILRERIPFAVGPADPRFFAEQQNSIENDEGNSDELDSRALDDYQEFVPAESQNFGTKVASASAGDAAAAAGNAVTGAILATNSETVSVAPDMATKSPVLAPAPVETSKLGDTNAATFHRIKPQSVAAAAAVAGANVVAAMKPDTTNDNSRHTKIALYDKLQKEGKSAAIGGAGDMSAALSGNDAADNLVVRQHLGVDGDMGMYLVALIAGVSAAVTVGMIALGIAWYTLQRKSKAAADVEYPAYGVTGPNKDISPSGDRKLAQSAQMYHYQHQKQQIIAMENRQAAEGSCGMSDVESDDEENEEGDYTVYECPGLAPPMGEMEVKNPLFLDETPVTPSSNTATVTTTSTPTTTNNITYTTPQQPPTQQLGKKLSYKVVVGAAPNPKATSAESTKSSEENSKKQKKNKK